MADNPSAELSDAELVSRARRGDTHAYGELWTRHAHAGLTVARHVSSRSEAEDLLGEAFASILRAIKNGRGPTGAFRPYLFTAIRHEAHRWYRRPEESVGLMEDLEAIELVDDDLSDAALEKNATVLAFRSLPASWRTVLWYTEVEGLEPHEVAPLLGMSANSAASLAFRAREGLRSAWIQMHLRLDEAPMRCRRPRSRLGDYIRGRLSDRERARVHEHLLACVRCSAVAEDARDVGSRLAGVLGPLVLGPTIGVGIAGLLSGTGGAHAAAAIPGVGIATTASTVGTVSTAGWVASLVAGIAAVTVTGGLILGPGTTPAPGMDASPVAVDETVTGVVVPSDEPGGDPDNVGSDTVIAADTIAPEPPQITSPADGSSQPTSTPPVAGNGEPGAEVVLTSGGVTLGIVPVDASGLWQLTTPSLADGMVTIEASQRDSAGNASPSARLAFTIDTVAAAPIIVIGAATPGRSPSLSGSAEPGARVSVATLQGPLCDTAADSAGAWNCGEPALEVGTWTISAIQTDTVGNVSPPGSVEVTIDGLQLATTGKSCTGRAPCSILLTGAPNAVVQLSVDGVVQQLSDRPNSAPSDTLQLNEGGRQLVKLDLGSGQHLVEARYVDPPTSWQGPWIGVTISVP